MTGSSCFQVANTTPSHRSQMRTRSTMPSFANAPMVSKKLATRVSARIPPEDYLAPASLGLPDPRDFWNLFGDKASGLSESFGFHRGANFGDCRDLIARSRVAH